METFVVELTDLAGRVWYLHCRRVPAKSRRPGPPPFDRNHWPGGATVFGPGRLLADLVKQSGLATRCAARAVPLAEALATWRAAPPTGRPASPPREAS